VIRVLVIVVVGYVGLVVSFETLVAVLGSRHGERGVNPDEAWLLVTTTDADGVEHDSVVAGVESGGELYIAANHWPRAWYDRAIGNPNVDVIAGGELRSYRVVVVTGEERDRIASDYDLPWPIRFATGFPPRSFLRLDPR
jgi:hypothetical protein